MGKKLFCMSMFAAAAFASTVAVSCSSVPTSVASITELAGYESMRAGGDRIDVDFENGIPGGFVFSITDSADIDEIVDIVLSSPLNLVYVNEPGDNTAFTVYQGENSYHMQTRGVTIDGNSYAFSSRRELSSKIAELAIERGAFDAQVGVAYKVIAKPDIENLGDEVKTATDKTALAELLAADFADCKYLYVCDDGEFGEPYSSGLLTTTDGDYVDTVDVSGDKLLVTYFIYKKYGEQSYYISAPTAASYELGSSVDAQYDFYVLSTSCRLTLTIMS